MTIAVSDICVGNRPAILGSYRRLAPIIGRVLWTSALATMIFGAGFVLLWIAVYVSAVGVVPGLLILIIAIVYMFAAGVYPMFAVSVVVLEGVSGIEAIMRSIHLVDKYFWRNLGVVMVTLVFGMIAAGIQVASQMSIDSTESAVEATSVVSVLINNAVLGILFAPSLVATVLLYYDCRVRKENFDREQLANCLTK